MRVKELGSFTAKVLISYKWRIHRTSDRLISPSSIFQSEPKSRKQSGIFNKCVLLVRNLDNVKVGFSIIGPNLRDQVISLESYLDIVDSANF